MNEIVKVFTYIWKFYIFNNTKQLLYTYIISIDFEWKIFETRFLYKSLIILVLEDIEGKKIIKKLSNYLENFFLIIKKKKDAYSNL